MYSCAKIPHSIFLCALSRRTMIAKIRKIHNIHRCQNAKLLKFVSIAFCMILFVDKNAAGYMIIVVKRKSKANDFGLGFVSFCALSLLTSTCIVKLNIFMVLGFVYFFAIRFVNMGLFVHMYVSSV